MPSYVVKQNEDLHSIVFKECGTTDISEVLAHPDNKKLFAIRDEYVLCPGDKVMLPDIRSGIEIIVESGKGYVLRPAKGRQIVIRAVSSQHSPIENSAYTLTIGEKEFEGATDKDGLLRQMVPYDAMEAKLCIGGQVVKLELAGLDPITTFHGIQARLSNLGYYRGLVDGEYGSRSKGAVMCFQRDNQLSVDGVVGKNTRKALLEKHGC